MGFLVIASTDTIAEAQEIHKIANYAKVGCVFRDLTKDKKDKVTLTECQTDKIAP